MCNRWIMLASQQGFWLYDEKVLFVFLSVRSDRFSRRLMFELNLKGAMECE
jgi:hypothetical protein